MNTHMIQPKLTEVLGAKGLSLYWLAQETGIAYTTLHRLRKAQANSVDFRVLDEICEALDCQPGDLLVRVSNGSRGTRIKADKTTGAKKSAKKKGTRAK
jgi:putative transcriptional regulator